ncbi:hypothetical protein KP509_1Z284100 [Ceratopteris richardii]|nr:hypothetical protein KP509_1Z284100 [Ceratopteris richardii]
MLIFFISAALFQSLLYEACGRTVNPVYGAVGLLWSGKWHICQEAVDTILSGGNLHSKAPSKSNESAIVNLNLVHSSSRKSGENTAEQHQRTTGPTPQRHVGFLFSESFHEKSVPAMAALQSHENSRSVHNILKRPRFSVDMSEETPALSISAGYTESLHESDLLSGMTKSCNGLVARCSKDPIRKRGTQHIGMENFRLDKNPLNMSSEVQLGLSLLHCETHSKDRLLRQASSPSEGSVVTSLGSPIVSSASCQNFKRFPSVAPSQDKKLLNLFT